MFLSYAVVPVFVLTVLLNFFYLYSPIDSIHCGNNFTSCQECLDSPCHKDFNRSCTINPDNTTYMCFMCNPDPAGNLQFYTKSECDKNCTDPAKTCTCDGACYLCISKEGLDPSKYTCTMPTQAVDDKCAIIPYGDCIPPSGIY